MSERNRSAFFALGLVAGLGIALLFLLWAVPEFRSPGAYPISQAAEQQSEAANGQSADADKQPDKPQWRYWTRRLVAAEDTLAQWVMAFFSIAATFVSVFAVLLVRDTLKINRKATRAALIAANHAADANALVRQEQRPWVVLDRQMPCSFMEDDDRATCNWQYSLINHGKLPARDTRVTQKLMRYGNDLWVYRKEYRDFVDQIRRGRLPGGKVMFPGETGKSEVDSSMMSRFETAGDKYALAVCVTYSTQDGLGLDCHFFFIEPDERFPIGPRIHRLISFGELRIVE